MKKTSRKSSGKKALRGRRVTPRAADGGVHSEPHWMPGLGELYRPIKKPVTLRLDADVLAWFKRHGSGYQTRINQALRGVMMKERKAAR